MTHVIHRPRGARGPGAIAAVASVLLLAACGGATGTAGPKVAAIPKSAAKSGVAGATTGTDVEDQRPLIRGDTPYSASLQLIGGWWLCLKNHGVPTHLTAGLNKPDVQENDPRYASAYQTCLVKKPEAFTDRMARKDPSTFQDDLTKWVRCQQERGMPVTVNKAHTSVEFTDGRISQTPEETRNLNDCEKLAFSE